MCIKNKIINNRSIKFAVNLIKMDYLISLDKQWLLLINSMNSQFGDIFFYIFTQTITWVPLYVLLAWVFFKHQGVKGMVSILFIALLVTLCDQIASNIFKELFERYRPSHDPVLKNMVHLVGGKRGGLYGFISSHAANSFGLAFFTILVFKNNFYTFAILTWAILNSYSRIYLGLHFPGDILGGLVCGFVVALLVYQLYLLVLPRFVVISYYNKRILKMAIARSFSKRTIAVLSFTILIMIVTLLISAKVVLKLL